MISGLVKMETAFPLKRNVMEVLIAMMDLMSLIVKRYVCIIISGVRPEGERALASKSKCR